MITLGDPRDLEVEIDVLSSDSVNVKPGAVVRFEHWGGDHPLAGRVRLVEPSGFTKVSALGVEEQRVNVLADFTDPLEKRGRWGTVTGSRRGSWSGNKMTCCRAGRRLFRQDDRWAVFRVTAGVRV